MTSHWPPLILPLVVDPQTVHVVHLSLQTDDDRLDQLQQLLSPDEAARADRFKVPLPRRHFIVCRAVLRQILASCLGCEPRDVQFTYGNHGKPALVAPAGFPADLQFSVSHSADQALIAIAAGRQVGVDIEQQDPSVRILKLSKRFFSPREDTELTALPESDQLAGFYRCWTSKEAYLKATGFGLSFSLSKFSVSVNPHQPAALMDVVDQPAELQRWRLLDLDPVPGFSAAILWEATAADGVALRQWSFDPGC